MLQRILTRLVLEQRLGHAGAVILSDADEQDEEYFLRFDREAFMLFNKEKLSKQVIKKSMEEEFVNPNAVNRLILDFLLKTGMHEEALIFAGEVGIDLANSHFYHIFRVIELLESLLEQRHIDKLINHLNEFDPRILAYNRLLHIQLLLFKLEETEKIDSLNEVTQLINHRVLPIIEGCTDNSERERLIHFIEKSIGSIFFQRKLPMSESDVMDGVREGLYEKSNLGASSKLEKLVEMSAAIQEVLKESCELRHIDECELFRLNDELSEI